VTKHFTAPDGSKVSREVELFTWEKLDYVDQIKTAFGLLFKLRQPVQTGFFHFKPYVNNI
jgi:hypothetical protein